MQSKPRETRTATPATACRRGYSIIKEGYVAETFCYFDLTLWAGRRAHSISRFWSNTNFINFTTVRALQIPTINLATPVLVETIDGQVLKEVSTTENMIPLQMALVLYTELLPLYVMDHLLILGSGWLKLHNSTIIWEIGSLSLSPQLANFTIFNQQPLCVKRRKAPKGERQSYWISTQISQMYSRKRKQ